MTILKNVPKPGKAGGASKYPELDALQVGEMFFVPVASGKAGRLTIDRIRQAATNNGQRHNKSFSVHPYTHEGVSGVGVWRNEGGHKARKPKA